jgi:hypothetical protein
MIIGCPVSSCFNYCIRIWHLRIWYYVFLCAKDTFNSIKIDRSCEESVVTRFLARYNGAHPVRINPMTS